jgi:hypothetical protein
MFGLDFKPWFSKQPPQPVVTSRRLEIHPVGIGDPAYSVNQAKYRIHIFANPIDASRFSQSSSEPFVLAELQWMLQHLPQGAVPPAQPAAAAPQVDHGHDAAV